MKAYIVWYEQFNQELIIPIDERGDLLWDKSNIDQLRDDELKRFGNEAGDDYFKDHEYSRCKGIEFVQWYIEGDINDGLWESEEIQELPVYPKTSREILEKQSLDDLAETFYNKFITTKYVPELFEMIPQDRLRNWITEQFEKEFSFRELKEMFEDENS